MGTRYFMEYYSFINLILSRRFNYDILLCMFIHAILLDSQCSLQQHVCFSPIYFRNNSSHLGYLTIYRYTTILPCIFQTNWKFYKS